MVCIFGLILVVCSGLYIEFNPGLYLVVYILGLIMVVCSGLYIWFNPGCM